MAIVAGVGAGAMAAIKPPYALVAIALTPYLAGADRRPRAVRRGRILCSGGGRLGLCGAGRARPFPHYVSDILPLGLAVYEPNRESFLELLSEPGVLLTLMLGAALVSLAARRLGEPKIAVAALASARRARRLFRARQGLALSGLSRAGLHDPGRRLRARAFAARSAPIAVGALAGVAAALLLLWLGRWPLPIAFAAAAGAGALLAALEPTGQPREWKTPLAEMGVAGAIGVACGLFAMNGVSTPALARALASLGPHPTVVAISESLAFGHPMVRCGWRRLGAEGSQPVDRLGRPPPHRRASGRRGARPALGPLYRSRSPHAGRGHRERPARRDPGRPARHALSPVGVERSRHHGRDAPITNSSPPSPAATSRRNSGRART